MIPSDLLLAKPGGWAGSRQQGSMALAAGAPGAGVGGQAGEAPEGLRGEVQERERPVVCRLSPFCSQLSEWTWI